MLSACITCRPSALHGFRICRAQWHERGAYRLRHVDRAPTRSIDPDVDEAACGGRREFAYLLQWPDEATMRAVWAAFMADEEWSRIKRETRVHGPMVGVIEDRTLVPVAYSPLREFPTAP